MPSLPQPLVQTIYDLFYFPMRYATFLVGLMILTLASLFIPPMVSSRVTVGVMNMILLCGFMLYIHSTVPSGEAGEPLIGKIFVHVKLDNI